MSEQSKQTEDIRLVMDVRQMQEIFGQNDVFLRKIEQDLSVEIFDRDGVLHIRGDREAAGRAAGILRGLQRRASIGATIEEQSVDYALDVSKEPMSETDAQLYEQIDTDVICHTVSGKPVRPKTIGQKTYVDAIRQHMVVFGLGPAGTGKTYLAMAMAITAFQREEVSRIILTRPAIEAGEKLGFLPGDLQSKVDPYLRPLYDALYQIMGAERFLANSEKGLIEVAPLAYMRGRTLDNAYIILDEAQNTTPAQMKMFLTRIGFGSKVVITGDATQKDLGAETRSGLDVAQSVLKGIDDIAFCTLTSRDVVRHPLVQQIVRAYEEYERKQTYRDKKDREKDRRRDFGRRDKNNR